MYEETDEEVRRSKISKIQTLEGKVQEYREVYETIRQNVVLKVTKNFTSNTFLVLIGLLTLLTLLLAVMFFFPVEIMQAMKEEGIYLSSNNRNLIMESFMVHKFVFIAIAFLFLTLGVLLRKNVKKRNTIYSLSKLVEEVIGYMENASEDEKRKYEYFVDNIEEHASKESTNIEQQPINEADTNEQNQAEPEPQPEV